MSADRDHTLLLMRDGFATVAYDFPERARRESPFDAGTLELQPAASLRGVLLDTELTATDPARSPRTLAELSLAPGERAECLLDLEAKRIEPLQSGIGEIAAGLRRSDAVPRRRGAARDRTSFAVRAALCAAPATPSPSAPYA